MQNYDYDAPRYSSGTARARTWDTIKCIIQYLFLFALSIYACHLYSYLGEWMLKFITAGTIATIVAYLLVPGGDRQATVADVRRNIFLYDVAAIGGFYLVSNIANIDSSMIGASFGLTTGTVMNNVFVGYVPVILQMFLMITPITHIFFEIKRIYTYHKKGYGKVTKRKRMEQLQRTIVK